MVANYVHEQIAWLPTLDRSAYIGQGVSLAGAGLQIRGCGQMKRAAHCDANHAEIVAHLKAIGCSVLSLAAVGKGCPDLLVGRRAVNVLIEVKNPLQKPSKRKLNEGQVDFHRRWGGQIAVAHTPAEAEAVVMVAERWIGGEEKAEEANNAK